MKSFLQKAKTQLKGDTGNQQNQQPFHATHQGISDPTALDILRYRYHHGTNLGSLYVIERWLQPSRFPEGAEGSSELAAVKAWVDREGIAGAKQKFEEHWATIVSDKAIGWLANVAKCTTIRLPIECARSRWIRTRILCHAPA
jgi:hypothetical protein